MKKAEFLLLIFMSFSSFAQQTETGFKIIGRDSELGSDLYYRALGYALFYVEEATPYLDAKEKALYDAVRSQLETVIISVADTSAAKSTCDKYPLLSTDTNFPNQIFICPKIKTYIEKNPSKEKLKALAQSYIHESVHLAGNLDECSAVKYEFEVMTKRPKKPDDELVYTTVSRDCYRASCGGLASFDYIASKLGYDGKMYTSNQNKSSRSRGSM